MRFYIVSFFMEDMGVQKFYPTPEELSSVCSKVMCPEDNCKALFQCTSNLNMHLIKHHKIKHSGLTAKNTKAQYFCPVYACTYHKDSKKHFGRLKYLKQHFLKVHAVKAFVCKKCDKKFSTETFLTLHLKNCGKIFTCTCGSCYTSSEAILTHIKRKGKGHIIVKNNEEKKINNINIRNKFSSKERIIYPKLSGDLSIPVHYTAAVALSELSAPQNLCKAIDKSVQTEIFDFDINQAGKYDRRGKNSQETQTTGKRKLKISTQTQTNNDYLKRRGKGPAKISYRKREKSIETQTKHHFKLDENDKRLYPNTREFLLSIKNPLAGKHDRNCSGKINLEIVKPKNEVADEEKARKWLWEMMSSSSSKTSEFDLMQYNNISSKNEPQCAPEHDSQGSQMFDLNRLCNIETQTDIDAFLTECNEDTNFTLCSTTETQTTDDFDCLLYSNMCTQTCEEVDQLFNFNFVHNETQTAWPDLNNCHELDSIRD